MAIRFLRIGLLVAALLGVAMGTVGSFQDTGQIFADGTKPGTSGG